MAKQTEIGYEASQEWADFQMGGTRIDAADLNHIEQGVTDACDAVDGLRTKRLPTYLVAQDGDTATQDLYQEPILGPCLILDLAERATYYENGEDGDSHERTLLTSGADIDDLRDSLSQTDKKDFGQSSAYKKAGVVTVNIASSATLEAWQYTDLFQLPEGWRPASETTTICGTKDSHMLLRVSPSGTVGVNPFNFAKTGSDSIYGSITFVTA